MKKRFHIFLVFVLWTSASLALSPFTLSGYFLYNNTASTPMDNVKVVLKLNGTRIDSTYTSSLGYYQFTGLTNNTYTIDAYSGKPWEGVNGTDALKVQRHFAGLELLTVPVRITAADVNNSGSINGTDALKIKRRFAGLDTGFERSEWTFEKVTGGNTILIAGADVVQDFYGLCTGDVNGSDTPLPGMPCPGMPGVTYEGKTYTTVQIGSQCWLAQNLNIGSRINGSATQTSNGIIEKYCYNDLESNCDVYGGIYQWDEMMQYLVTEGVKGICPPDWHLPTDAEWTTLSNFLGGLSVAGGAMKETGTTHWNTPNVGATNSSLFTGLPGGFRSISGPFAEIGDDGYWWTSTPNIANNQWERKLYRGDAILRSNYFGKLQGFSVRCMSGAGPVSLPVLNTAAVTVIASGSATGGGTILTDGGGTVSARGICWGTAQNPTISGSHTTDGSGIGPFTSNITGLTPNILYYARAYATNTAGTAYGNEVTFITGVPCGTSITRYHSSGSVAPVTKTVTYATVSNIPGDPSKCWITSNLGADHQATAVDDATEASAGWYWQFNRKQGYKHDGINRTPNTTWITTIDEDMNWQASNDPCALELGVGWRIPTSTEWANIDASGGGNWTNWNGPWNSALKIHAAGSLPPDDGNFLSWRGAKGKYWSATQYGTAGGHELYFTSSIGGNYINYYKASGNALRCIRSY